MNAPLPLDPAWPFSGLSPRGYGLIVVDPPWRFIARSDKGVTAKSAGGQYGTMNVDEIAALPVRDLADPNGALLFLWHTEAMARSVYDVLDAWGATYASRLVWVKTTARGGLGFGTGYWTRCAHEPVAIAKFGSPRVQVKNQRSVFHGLVREHSRKPAEFWPIAERMAAPGVARAELFSRETRPGWDCWGHESGKFDEVAA